VSQTRAAPPAAAQSVFMRHWTHCMVVVSQTRVKPAIHCALLMHVVAHVWEAVLQTCPVAQSVVMRHCTQVSVDVSHTRPPPPPPQSPFARHWTQCIVVVLHTR
jgi:hypothetical protein